MNAAIPGPLREVDAWMSDEIGILLGKIALKDRMALSELYRRTSPKLFGICLRLLKDRSEAEDAMQEIFVKIWQRAQSFAATGHNAMGWLGTIARYHCIDRLRTRTPVSIELDEAWHVADSAPDPEQTASIRSEGKRIDSCMEALEADRAAAVRQAYVEGLSYQELAEQFNVPLNTMRTWLRRSLLALRECLER
ncbi:MULTISPECIES: sigma-70 family RNA polymerase sigma factor [Rhizobium/Agrobacterium group]|uniref:Sigma factor n=2 Tax=Rhizobium/Agrobacterium group TaxID=227290 RepID=B9JZL2_ALLAM|nr:sigma factor [Allorhizobium ampelinum S4]